MPHWAMPEAGASDDPSRADDAGPDRRAFLAAVAGLSGAGWLALNAPAVLSAAEAAEQNRVAGADFTRLTAAEAAATAALVDQIIPPDDLPGAAELGAVHFIDQALGGFLAEAADGWREGLADLDRRARRDGGAASGFADLPFDEQTALLRDLEDTPFFRQAILLTHCGLFALPAWGGNRDGAGWTLLGFDSRHAWEPPFGHYDAAAQGDADTGKGGHGAA